MKHVKGTVQFAVVAVIGMFVVMSPSALTYAEELRILAWEGYMPAEHVDAFKQLIQEKYNVDLDITISYISSPDDVYNALKNRQADIAPLVQNLPKDPKYKFIAGKFLAPVDVNNILRYTDLIPALQQADSMTEKGQVYGVPFVYGVYGLAYNTDLVKEEPTSWNIFWDPAYAGQYTISSDYSEINIYITALAMGIGRDKMSQWDMVKSDEFIEKLTYFAKNAKSLWVGSETADDLQGLPLAAAWGAAFSELKERGESWKMASPAEGTTGWVDHWVLSHTLRKNPSLKRIAEEWINYAISPEFQAATARSLGYFPVNLMTKEQMTPEEIEKFHLDDPTYFQENFIPWPLLDKQTRTGFELLWKKATR
ncbi:MAG: extracellular solute-binding protein [bacterium]|nr:extracellular solute-binding protein [bacterium]